MISGSRCRYLNLSWNDIITFFREKCQNVRLTMCLGGVTILFKRFVNQMGLIYHGSASQCDKIKNETIRNSAKSPFGGCQVVQQKGRYGGGFTTLLLKQMLTSNAGNGSSFFISPGMVDAIRQLCPLVLRVFLKLSLPTITDHGFKYSNGLMTWMICASCGKPNHQFRPIKQPSQIGLYPTTKST